MKNLFVIATIALLLYNPISMVKAQNNDNAIDIEQINIENEQQNALNNEVSLLQLGDENNAYIKQVGLHTTTVNQQGLNNSMYVLQNGLNGQFALSQTGNMNNYYGELNGDFIEVYITQDGNYNTVQQQISSNFAKSNIVQDGQYNSVIHTSTATDSPELNIQQRGNNMQLIIRSY